MNGWISTFFTMLLVGSYLVVEAVAAEPGVYATRNHGVKLPSSHIFQTKQVKCGRINDRWQAGKLLKGGWFLTHRDQIRMIKRKLQRGVGSREVLIMRVTRLSQRMRKQNKFCRKAAIRRISFNLRDVVGVALLEASSRSGYNDVSSMTERSNLRGVKETGEMDDALESGSATVSNFLIAPNNKLYVEFSQPINLEDSKPNYLTGCLLAEVDVSSGKPVCIDNELNSVHWPSMNPTVRNAAIQFDDSGAIYYVGTNKDRNTVLRKYYEGVTSELINQNIDVSDFLVLDDGVVIIRGNTVSSGLGWLRRLGVNGDIKTIANNLALGYPGFMRRFPDGNVYMGLQGPKDQYGNSLNLLAPYSRAHDAIDYTRAVTGIYSSAAAIDVGVLRSDNEKIAVGYSTCIVSTGGVVKCSFVNRGAFDGFSIVDIGTDVTDVSVGSGDSGEHYCVLTNTGGIRCWGSNEWGQVGDGTRLNSVLPLMELNISLSH